jgi:2-oxoglutarate ferredoxin oxidoreductase subunit delta
MAGRKPGFGNDPGARRQKKMTAEMIDSRPALRKKQVPFPERMRTDPVDIFEPWCKNCGLCVSFCPAEVFAFLDTGKVVVNSPQQCKQCGICANVCPDMAILLLPKPKRAQ